MSIIRWFLKWLVYAADFLFQPRFKQREASAQQRMDSRTSNMTLYQFAACPFCVKVRWGCKRLGLNIAIRDAKNDPYNRQKLLTGGGKIKVPCLHVIENGKSEWIYESNDILEYLAKIESNSPAKNHQPSEAS